MKSFLFTISFFLFTSFAFAQSDRDENIPNRYQADNLLQVLQTIKNDTVRIVIYKKLQAYSFFKKPDSFHYYNEQKLKLALKLNQKLWEAESYLSEVYSNIGTDVPKALI